MKFVQWLRRARRHAILFALAASAAALVHAAPPLPALGAEAGVTVSGISSGGYMAVQFQVAHSALVRGAGVLAAGPYDCAQGSVLRALSNCMEAASVRELPTPAQTLARIDAYARAGRVDGAENLADDRVWVLWGERDRTVAQPVVEALVDFYRSVLPGDAVRTVNVADAGHAMISIAEPAANSCASSQPPYINRCGDFDAAGELLAHLLGPLAARANTPAGELIAFDQTEFIAGNPADASMANEGYAYLPAACRAGGCRVHLALHGCQQSATQIGERFVRGAGYNEWADNNRLIVLYPQTRPRSGFALWSWRWVYNPKGCWDWWGYSGAGYATREGGQMRALHAMLERMAQPAAALTPAPSPGARTE